MNQFFKIQERGSTVRTEVMAGLTTFMAMAYILMVNAGMFAELDGVTYNAVYIATAISAVVGTVLIGLLSNLPLGQASGMGLNAFFVYTVCMGFGLTSTCVTLASFNILNGTASWATIMPLLVTILAVIAIAVMSARGFKGAVIWGILGGAVLYYLLGFTVSGFYDGFAAGLSFNPLSAFGDFFHLSFGKVFTDGLDFSAYLQTHDTTSLVILIATTALAFCLVDMFDTLGTLYGACARGNMLDKDGNVPNMERAMLADAIATTTGAICGTSTVTTFVESSAGIAEGGRTGLTSLVTAALFFVAMFLSPVAALVPSCATAAALIYVGVLMMHCVKDIDWTNAAVAVPAFLTIAMMPFAYNISYGISFGIFSYILISLFTGKAKEIKVGTWVIGILFAAMFLLTH